MVILVTGGAGYIGSHTTLLLLEAGYDVVVLDNLVNSSKKSLERVEAITGKDLVFIEGDMQNHQTLDDLFTQHPIQAVIHFAGLKAVGESTQMPLQYYRNNVGGTQTLLEAMTDHGVKNMIFSSSATVYGLDATIPYTEDMPLGAVNPYGHTKQIIEYMLEDTYRSDPDWRICVLRYFNPIGAHESGRIGEAPQGIPNNVMPYITQVAAGILPHLNIFGDDYDTPDGTGVRDYIHVMDLAQGHLDALKKIQRDAGLFTYNLGSGQGTSVMELIKAFEQVNDLAIAYRIAPRRPGDLPTSYADPSKANHGLGWRTRCSVEDMCRDAWRWQSANPRGYEEE